MRRGETLASVYGRDRALAERVGANLVAPAFRVDASSPRPRTLIRHLVTASGVRLWGGGEDWDQAFRARGEQTKSAVGKGSR